MASPIRQTSECKKMSVRILLTGITTKKRKNAFARTTSEFEKNLKRTYTLFKNY